MRSPVSLVASLAMWWKTFQHSEECKRVCGGELGVLLGGGASATTYKGLLRRQSVDVVPWEVAAGAEP
jgi:hypothetical protein